MNIGRKTAKKRLRNSARETVAGGASAEIWSRPRFFAREQELLDVRARRGRFVPADELDLGNAARVARLGEDDQHARRRRIVRQHDTEHLRAGTLAERV